MHRDRGELAIISCLAGFPLANRVIEHINRLLSDKDQPTISIVDSQEVLFSNKEIKTVINKPIRGSDVYIIQLFDDPVHPSWPKNSINDNLMALFTAINAAKNSDADCITAIIPQFPYSRQEKRLCREAITAKLAVDFLELSGADRIITLDIHSPAIAGFFQQAKFDNIEAKNIIIQKVKDLYHKDNIVVVSPDVGGISRAKKYASMLNVKLALFYKQRDYDKKSTIAETLLIGDVSGKDILLIDDMVATGGSFLKAIELLKKNNAKNIYLAASMPFFNDNSHIKFKQAYEEGLFTKFIGTDAVFHGEDFINDNPWYEEVSIAPLLANVIYNINNRLSISPLLE